MEFVDERDVFFFLLSNFLDWNSPGLLSRFESTETNFDYIDELAILLPSDFEDVGDEITGFLQQFIDRMPLSDEDIERLQNYADSLPMDRTSPKSDFTYIFPFSRASGVSSYAFTVLLTMGCNLSIPIMSPFYAPNPCSVTDILDYISTQQWRMLIRAKYDFTSPTSRLDNISRLALHLCETHDTSFTRDEFIDLLFHSTLRINRPGHALSHLLKHYIHDVELADLLVMMRQEIGRIYVDVPMEEEDPESPKQIEIPSNLDETTPWETLFTISNRLGITFFPTQRDTLALLIQIRLMLSSIEMGDDASWNDIMKFGALLGLETISVEKNEALRQLMEYALQRSLIITPTLSWEALLRLVKVVPCGTLSSVPTTKEDLIQKILSR